MQSGNVLSCIYLCVYL